MTYDTGTGLETLFAPRSIAVIGASTRPTAPPTRLIRTLRSSGYKGRILPVNGKYDTVECLDCYPSLADLPLVPDLAVVGIAAAGAAGALAECGRAGVKNAVIISAGFGELGVAGRQLQAEMADTAARYGITVLGPNTMGFANVRDSAHVTFSSVLGDRQSPGPVAVASQSGGVAGGICELLERDSIGKSLIVAVGNEAGLDLADVVWYAARQEDTTAVCVYAENLHRAGRLLDAIQTATSNGTSVIVITAGLSQAGAKAASSHTGAIAQQPFVVRQLFTRAGALLADSPQQAASLVGAVALDRRSWPPVSRPARAAVIATSGGYGVLAADAADRQGVTLTAFSDKTLQRLGGLLPSYMKPGNPVDLPPEVITDPTLITEIALAVAADENIDAVVVAGAMRTGAPGAPAATAFATALGATATPAIAAWPSLSTEIRQIFAAANMGCAESADDVFHVAAHRLAGTAGQATAAKPARPAPAAAAPAAPWDGTSLVTEITLKHELACLGIVVPEGQVVTSAADAEAAAGALGFPLVAKGISPRVAHKAAAGLVVLPVESAQALATAYHSLSERLGQLGQPGDDDGKVLIERMVPSGPEIFAGLSRDPALGDLIMLGAGGGNVEADGESALQVARTSQLTTPQRRAAFTSHALNAFPATTTSTSGTANAAALETLITTLLCYWNEREDLLQLELNPIIWSAGTLTVADALAVRAR